MGTDRERLEVGTPDRSPPRAGGCLAQLFAPVRFLLPQIPLIALFALLGLVWGVIRGMGGFAEAVESLRSDAAGGPGPGHVGGPAILVGVLVVVSLLGLALAFAVTVEGFLAALHAAALGFVVSCLLDFACAWRRPIDPASPYVIKRWAGRGAALATVACGWLLLFNPPRTVLGVYAITGTILCLAFGTVGLVRFGLARCRSEVSGEAPGPRPARSSA